jgi:hypothetical protein
VIGGRRAGCAALACAAACAAPAAVAPTTAAPAGTSIAIYGVGPDAYGLVDDRRWVEVDADRLVLDRIDPRAELASLVIEPLGGGAIAALACARDRLPGVDAEPGALPVTPVLRCTVRAARGRHLVRVLYVVPGMRVVARHEIAMSAPDRATVGSRFAIVTPGWRARAELTLFDAAPGGDRPPRVLATGPVVLDGGTAVLTIPARAVPARLRRIVALTAGDGAPAAAVVWAWLELELGDGSLAPGPVRARVELPGELARDLEVAAAGRRSAGARLRLPLWVDPQLRALPAAVRGRRGGSLARRTEVSIANTGELAREVWIAAPPRLGRPGAAPRMWPGDPVAIGDQLAVKLTVAPGKIERGGFELPAAP